MFKKMVLKVEVAGVGGGVGTHGEIPLADRDSTVPRAMVTGVSSSQ